MNPFSPLDWFTKLLPDSSDPEQLLKWRAKIVFSIMLLFLTMVGLTVTAETRFETKSNADLVHTQLQKDVGEIKHGLESLTQAVNASERARQESERQRAVREVRQRIYETQRQACLSDGALRSLLFSQVSELKSEYMALTGEEYPNLDCSEF